MAPGLTKGAQQNGKYTQNVYVSIIFDRAGMMRIVRSGIEDAAARWVMVQAKR